MLSRSLASAAFSCRQLDTRHTVDTGMFFQRRQKGPGLDIRLLNVFRALTGKETWRTTCGPSQYLISGAIELWMPRRSDSSGAADNEERENAWLANNVAANPPVCGARAIPNNTSECWVFEISILLVSLLWLRRYSSADKFVRGTERENEMMPTFFLFHKDLFEVAMRYLYSQTDAHKKMELNNE